VGVRDGMTAPQFRAWHFAHPEVEVAAEPGLQVSKAGGIQMVQGHASVRQALLLLLSTLPGERVMRPDYGCDLFRLVFAPNDHTTAGLAIHYVRSAIARWEPRVEVVRIDAEQSPDTPDRLDITLEYRIRATQASDGVTIGLDLQEGALR
jgi:phage baseplate assembly protein W